MALEAWIIEQHEEERRRRQQDEARRSRIELPLTCPLPSTGSDGPEERSEEVAHERPTRGVEIIPLSPTDAHAERGAFDL